MTTQLLQPYAPEDCPTCRYQAPGPRCAAPGNVDRPDLPARPGRTFCAHHKFAPDEPLTCHECANEVKGRTP